MTAKYFLHSLLLLLVSTTIASAEDTNWPPVRHERRDERHPALEQRQSEATTNAVCYDADGLDYVSNGSVFEIQCDHQYLGSIIATSPSTSFADCIASCLEAVCAGATFENVGSDTQAGTCVTFSNINATSSANNALGFADSAILVIYANGEAVPNPGTLLSPTSSNNNPSTPSSDVTVTADTSQTTPKGTGTLSSGSTVDAAAGGSSPALNVVNLSSPDHVSSVTGITSTPSINAMTFFSTAMQATFTTVKTYTRYQVQTARICRETPHTCSISIVTASQVQYSTAISCSPGACTGFPYSIQGLCTMPS